MRRFVKQNKRKGSFLHVSAPLVRVKDPETGLSSWRVVRPGRTYHSATPNVRQTRQVRKQRKAAKRAARSLQ